mmetsp:Transcript_24324/g.84510  ORF Transcript_24324/g.84510 Transcript_24324/m.84510 type:complete len:301 (-) Transcript_24324:82-984(-)
MAPVADDELELQNDARGAVLVAVRLLPTRVADHLGDHRHDVEGVSVGAARGRHQVGECRVALNEIVFSRLAALPDNDGESRRVGCRKPNAADVEARVPHARRVVHLMLDPVPTARRAQREMRRATHYRVAGTARRDTHCRDECASARIGVSERAAQTARDGDCDDAPTPLLSPRRRRAVALHGINCAISTHRVHAPPRAGPAARYRRRSPRAASRWNAVSQRLPAPLPAFPHAPGRPAATVHPASTNTDPRDSVWGPGARGGVRTAARAAGQARDGSCLASCLVPPAGIPGTARRRAARI